MCYVYGLGTVAAKIDGGAVSIVLDPMPAIEPDANGSPYFQSFVTSDATYLVRGWYHSGRDENYKVIYKVGATGAEFAYQTSGSFSVLSPWTNVDGNGTYLPCVGSLSGSVLWLRGQTQWGETSPGYVYQRLDLVSGATATDPPTVAIVFPQPYDVVDDVWVSDFHYVWGGGEESMDIASSFTQHKLLLLDRAAMGYDESSTYRAYPAASAWATSSAGHGLPPVEYTSLTYTAPGFTKLVDPFIYSVFSQTVVTVWTPWWKNKAGVLEIE